MRQTITRLQHRVNFLWTVHLVYTALEVLEKLIKMYLYLHK